MKLKMVIAAAALALLGATSAHAQLSITLDSPVQDATAPSFVTFSGLITNIGDDPITIVGDSLSAPAGVGIDLPQSDLVIGNFPITLGPDDSFYGDWLFGLDIPASQTASFSGTYAVLGEDLQGNPLDPFSTDYTVNIQGGGQVPEPGTMALLVSGLVGGSLFLVRRRK